MDCEPMFLKRFIVENLTFLGRYKRFLVAVGAVCLPRRKSYSQHQEDEFILSYLRKFDLRDSVYVDVGANHPTDISNTYLLYRHGYRGIVIEPNEELVDLFKIFRKDDIVLMLGCSNEAALLKFYISKTPVISSFSNRREVNLDRSVYLPLLPLDTITRELHFKFIHFLSIDVEGLNFEVLEGATETLKKSLIVCLEYDLESEKENFRIQLGGDFDLLSVFGCNLIYVNRSLEKQIIVVNT